MPVTRLSFARADLLTRIDSSEERTFLTLLERAQTRM